MSLSPKQAVFIREYLVDLNATQAAIRAGYSPMTARQAASRLLSKVNVKEAIDDAKRQRAERVEVKQDEVLRELLRIMKTDISEAFGENGQLLPLRDMSEEFRRAISSVEVDGDKPVKLKLWNKIEAIRLAGQHLKLFTEKHVHEHSYSEMTDEQLEAKYREITQKEPTK